MRAYCKLAYVSQSILRSFRPLLQYMMDVCQCITAGNWQSTTREISSYIFLSYGVCQKKEGKHNTHSQQTRHGLATYTRWLITWTHQLDVCISKRQYNIIMKCQEKIGTGFLVITYIPFCYISKSFMKPFEKPGFIFVYFLRYLVDRKENELPAKEVYFA